MWYLLVSCSVALSKHKIFTPPPSPHINEPFSHESCASCTDYKTLHFFPDQTSTKIGCISMIPGTRFCSFSSVYVVRLVFRFFTCAGLMPKKLSSIENFSLFEHRITYSLKAVIKQNITTDGMLLASAL